MQTSGVIEGSDDITDDVFVDSRSEKDSKFNSEVNNKEAECPLLSNEL